MAKAERRFVCQECGAVMPRWLGRCRECGAWNSIAEEEAPAAGAPAAQMPAGEVAAITAVPMTGWQRVSTGIGELDRVLGGGLVPGSLVLVGGDPGIGKSTLLLQAAARMAVETAPVLYVTGEESPQQVRHRAERLNALTPHLHLGAGSNIDQVIGWARELNPGFLVIDSIQTMIDPAAGAAAGTVGQVRTCCARLAELARSLSCGVLIVGHVTKEGLLAGPRVLEHMVDCVLYFEGDRFQSYRILRAVKNRFGAADEIGVWEMSGSGLQEVASPSDLFLPSEENAGAPGSAVAVLLEGTRPLLVEIQALVARSYLAAPRRATQGIDPNRAAMIIAVLERRCGMKLGDQDIFLNAAGGLRVAEPGADLPCALALAAAARGSETNLRLVAAGEIGLGGELRQTAGMERRLREAARLGFKLAVTPPCQGLKIAGLQVCECATLAQAISVAAPRRAADREESF